MVVPAFNEAQHIERTLTTIPEWVDDVVVVDDGSWDGTADCCRRVDRTITVVRHPINRGAGAALRTGYQVAFAGGADVVAVMAGDGQMDPAELEDVVAPVATGVADYCKGNRLAHPRAAYDMPRLRRIGSRVLSAATRFFTALPIQDSQCGFTALGSHGARRLNLERLWSGYGYPNDLLVMAARAGLRVHEVVVRPLYHGQASGLRWWHGVFVVPFVLLRAGFIDARGGRRTRTDASASVRPS